MKLSICLVLAAVATKSTYGQVDGLTPEVLPSLPVGALSTVPDLPVPELSLAPEIPVLPEVPGLQDVVEIPAIRMRSL